jgi:hypothetical protein
MAQSGGLQRSTSRFLCQSGGCEPTKFVTDEREELHGRTGVAV